MNLSCRATLFNFFYHFTKLVMWSPSWHPIRCNLMYTTILILFFFHYLVISDDIWWTLEAIPNIPDTNFFFSSDFLTIFWVETDKFPYFKMYHRLWKYYLYIGNNSCIVPIFFYFLIIFWLYLDRFPYLEVDPVPWTQSLQYDSSCKYYL